MIKEVIEALKLPVGYLIHKNHECYCTGPDKHPIGLLTPVDGTDFIAVGNAYEDSMLTLDPTQIGYDTTLTCKVCGQKGVTL